MFLCCACDKTFDSQKRLNAHKVAHKIGKRYSVTKIKNSTYLCLYCNKESITQNNKRNKFCSNLCSVSHKNKETFSKIEEGIIFSFRIMKKYLLQIKNKCFECGISETYNGKPIVLHCDHIDGDSDNNKLTNLRLLCPNCHSQTDTYCGRNIKNSKRSKYARLWRKKIQSNTGTE